MNKGENIVLVSDSDDEYVCPDNELDGLGLLLKILDEEEHDVQPQPLRLESASSSSHCMHPATWPKINKVETQIDADSSLDGESLGESDLEYIRDLRIAGDDEMSDAVDDFIPCDLGGELVPDQEGESIPPDSLVITLSQTHREPQWISEVYSDPLFIWALNQQIHLAEVHASIDMSYLRAGGANLSICDVNKHGRCT